MCLLRSYKNDKHGLSKIFFSVQPKQFEILILFSTMDFSSLIAEYKESNCTKSPIWVFFDNEKDFGKCRICQSRIKVTNYSTTNLIFHLKRHHGFLKKYNAYQEYEKLTELKEERVRNAKRKNSERDNSEEPVQKQPKIGDSLNNPYPPNHPRQIALTNALGLMICADGQPVSTVERKGFQNFVQKADPRFTIPHRTTFTRKIIPELNDVVHTDQINRLDRAIKRECSIACSTDGYEGKDANSSSVYDFCTYFYEETEICAEVIAVKRLEKTDGETVAKFLKQCLTDIKVLDSDGKPKIDIWFVTDAGSNVVRALNILKTEGVISGYHTCWNHKLQSAIRDAIKCTEGMEDTLTALQTNAATYSRCKNERRDVREVAQIQGVPKLSIPLPPGVTRWFARLIMAMGFAKAERVFKIHFLESDKMIDLTAADWKKIHGYIATMKPLQEAAKMAEGERYLTSGSIIPMLSVLTDRLKAFIRDPANRGFGVTFAKNLLAALEDRFGSFPDYYLRPPYSLATFSDPCFSWLFFKNGPQMAHVNTEIIKQATKELEKMEIEDGDSNAQSESHNSGGSESFWGDFDAAAATESTRSTSIESEIQLWSGVSRIPRKSNPIHAMDVLKKDFPRIHKLFRKYSIYPATQNKDERLFSMVGRNTGPQCRSLKIETIEKKVVVGSAVQKHGFIYNYKDAKKPNESSSDDGDSF